MEKWPTGTGEGKCVCGVGSYTARSCLSEEKFVHLPSGPEGGKEEEVTRIVPYSRKQRPQLVAKNSIKKNVAQAYSKLWARIENLVLGL